MEQSVIFYALAVSFVTCAAFAWIAIRFRAQARAAEAALAEVRQQLTRAENFAALGGSVAGVAHELNNPLAVILALSEEIEDPGTANDRRAYLSGELKPYVMRMARIIEALRRRSRKRPVQNREQVTSLNSLIDNSLVLMDVRIRNNAVTFVREVPDDVGIRGDAVRIESVFGNLIQNALDAFEEVPQGPDDDRVRSIRITAKETSEGGLAIEVADNGPGIPEAIVRRIFEPFFTTKEPERGTGLGLSICARAIEEIGGSITVRSNPGEGTIFLIQLPAERIGHSESQIAA